MRIAELSRQSGATIPTIKYYLREGLLPPGERTNRNQASYGEVHLQRLRLIRALREVGGLSVAAARDVLQVLDEPSRSPYELMGRAHRAVLQRPAHDPADPEWAAARAQALAQVRRLGWQVNPQSPALDQLAEVILALRRVGRDGMLEQLPRYAQAAMSVAEPEVTGASAAGDPAAVMATVVTGTVLGGALLSTLRLLAHEQVSAQLSDRAAGR